jgi:hypothetical protein
VNDETHEQSTPAVSATRKKTRRQMLAVFGGVLILAGACFVVWLIFFAGKTVSRRVICN